MRKIKFPFLSIFLFIFVSCSFSPGMNPNIQNNIPFDQIDLTFYEINSMDLSQLPSQSQKYQEDQSKLQALIDNNEYRYIIGNGDVGM